MTSLYTKYARISVSVSVSATTTCSTSAGSHDVSADHQQILNVTRIQVASNQLYNYTYSTVSVTTIAAENEWAKNVEHLHLCHLQVTRTIITCTQQCDTSIVGVQQNFIDEKQVSVTFHILQHQAHDAVGEWSGRTGGGAGRKASQSNLLQVAAQPRWEINDLSGEIELLLDSRQLLLSRSVWLLRHVVKHW